MKLEPRGKYPGVKIHLDEKEVEALKVSGQLIGGEPIPNLTVDHPFYRFGQKLSRKIHALMAEHPDLLMPRTPEQIKAELQLEQQKAADKLAKMAEGAKWNE